MGYQIKDRARRLAHRRLLRKQERLMQQLLERQRLDDHARKPVDPRPRLRLHIRKRGTDA